MSAERAEQASITVYKDGPMLVRGDVVIMTEDGQPVPRTRRTIALCRCGKSQSKPLCDGTHKLVKFRD